MKHVSFKLIILPFLLTLLLMACSRDKAVENQSPAYHIRQSEKLDIPETIDLPANVPDGNSRVATFYAEGVQKYKSQVRGGSFPTAYEWKFVAPEAMLFDSRNQLVGTHGAGPTWQLFGNADSIYGQAFIPARYAVSPDPTAIDWLLLMPKTGHQATGIFADVSYIQRIATRGGKAPATPPTTDNETVNVPYTAVYRFTKIN